MVATAAKASTELYLAQPGYVKGWGGMRVAILHNYDDAQTFLGPKMLPESRGEQHEYLIVPMEEELTKTSYLPASYARIRIISDILGCREFPFGCLGPGEPFLVAGSWLRPNIYYGQCLPELHLGLIYGRLEGKGLIFFASLSHCLA